MANMICAVTGANTGIGKATAAGLAARGARVLLVCRSLERGEAACREITASTGNDAVEVVQIDLGSLASIRQGARTIRERCPRLDVLVNNASVVTMERAESVDGLELQFAVNHLGYYLLTNELLALLKASAPARIVNVSAGAYRIARLDLDDLQWARRPYRGLRVYATTKLLEILFTYELARRLEGTGVTTNALHPGGVATDLARNWPAWTRPFVTFLNVFLPSPEKGAETPLYLASSPEVESITGRYFVGKKARRTTSLTYDRQLALRVWEISERLCGIEGGSTALPGR